jgi:hypothetical protein
VTDLSQEIQHAISDRNFPASSHLLNHVRKANLITEVADTLEEDYNSLSYHTLELRDHISYYLGMWDVYFAVQISSLDMLRLLKDDMSIDPQTFMIEFTRRLLDSLDPRFDQFYASVETISKGQYAVLLPQILAHRTEELENCTIFYKREPTPLYCTANLLRTYYGEKIISATLSDQVFESVVGEKAFSLIERALISAGLDISKMLVEVNSEDWEDIICRVIKIESPPEESKELRTLHRVYAARSEIFLNSFRKQAAALDTILNSKTQLCNDTLMTVAADRKHEMRLRAVKGLGDIGSTAALEFLSGMLNDSDSSIRGVAARALSILASHSKWSTVDHKIPATTSKTPALDISKISRILNTMIAKEMPVAMIEDTLTAVANQDGRNAANILTRLLTKPQISVKKAVIKTSQLLAREYAAPVIRKALDDDSPEVVALAEKELNTRWPDEVWK